MMDKIIDAYKLQLNLEGCEFSLIKHENAIVAIVYHVKKFDGSEYILKVCSRAEDYFREKYFLNHFNTIIPVAKIINVVEPGTDIHGAILMQCLPGNLLQPPELNEELAYEIGIILGKIHLNKSEYYGDLIDTKSLSLDPKQHFIFKFEESLRECENHLPSNLLEQCRLYYDLHINLLDSVDGPCIIHRDFRPGNIIVNNGKLQGIIDWASARSGFAEDDFCPWEQGEWNANANNKQSFLNGYASIRPVPDYKSIMPFLRLNRAINTIGFTIKRGIWDNSSERLYKANREFINNLLSDANLP